MWANRSARKSSRSISVRSMRWALALSWALFVSFAQASSPHKETVTFSYTADVGFGNSVFVVGNHPDVGNWDITHAVKLRYTAGNVWTGQIAIQAGTQLQYRFISRSNANSDWCDASKVLYLTENLSRTIPAQPDAPYHGKTIYYLSSWNPPNLFYNNNGTWTSVSMLRVGAGRTSGESLFKISGHRLRRRTNRIRFHRRQWQLRQSARRWELPDRP